MTPTSSEESMANSKERIDELETNLGLVRDEVRGLGTVMEEKIKSMGESFNRSMEESLDRVMETMRTMMTNRDGGVSLQREGLRREETIH